ncbi:hypothetical protein TNCV_1366681 [Trichonephila clavipes]|nr:hypothetical protein TNCV_1366681 [Trichonephila clavipes]
MPLQQENILNIRRVASPLVRLVEGEERLLTPPPGILPQNWFGTELNRSVMVLKTTADDWHISSPLP